jgi:L-lactate utilization protein LutC
MAVVIGPSRTGNIEQTMEFSAHGPKGLVMLVVKTWIKKRAVARI